MKTSRISLLAVAAAMLVTGKSQAANISFNDTAADDTVTINGTQFDAGPFLVNGSDTFNNVPISEANGPITFSGAYVANISPGTGSRTIYLVENWDHNVISDILSYSWTTDGPVFLNGSFVSDFEDNLGTIAQLPAAPAPGDIFVEDGTPITFALENLTAEVASDVDPVPEPSTWAACGFVALMAGGTLYRRFRR